MNKRISLGLVGFALIGVLPFAAALGYALLYSLGLVGALSQGFTLAHWQEVLASGEVWRSFGYSALIAAVSLGLSVAGALGLTLLFRREFQRKGLLLVLYLPLAVPGVVSAFFAYQLLAKTGFFSRVAYQLGAIAEARAFPDLVNDSLAFGIVLTFVTVVLPFFLLLFLNVYKNERLEALSNMAATLGANPREVTIRVVVPVLLRRTRILISLYFIFLLGAYEVPLILGQSSPQMLSVLIVREVNQYDLTKLPEGYVIAVIYTLLVSAGVLLLFARSKPMQHES